MIDGSKRGLMQVKDVRSFLNSVLDEDIHTKRIASLANATLGVMTGASLGVAVIGKSLAQARGLLPKHRQFLSFGGCHGSVLAASRCVE